MLIVHVLAVIYGYWPEWRERLRRVDWRDVANTADAVCRPVALALVCAGAVFLAAHIHDHLGTLHLGTQNLLAG
jgi:hypothetical protein